MIALDTNVLVRILARDDENQALRAASLIEKNRVFVSLTVIIETEWVLRSVYRADRTMIASAFRTILGIANIKLGDRLAVRSALALYDHGFDFADALHLASSAEAGSFATFDLKLQRTARSAGVHPPVILPE